jgi:hypothetical protein
VNQIGGHPEGAGAPGGLQRLYALSAKCLVILAKDQPSSRSREEPIAADW